MLSYRLLKNHAGMLLIGDYYTLRQLHEVIHDVNGRSPLIHDEDGWFIGLAYDVRKAYERQREVIEPPENFEEIGPLYGVEILWPVLLAQHRILRVSLGYIDHSKRHQAITYALEAVIEDAIADDFGINGLKIQERWLRLAPTNSWLEEKLSSRGAVFCSWSKNQRKNGLANLLDSLDPMFPATYKFRVLNGDVGLLSPEDLDAWSDKEWPDPKWK